MRMIVVQIFWIVHIALLFIVVLTIGLYTNLTYVKIFSNVTPPMALIMPD